MVLYTFVDVLLTVLGCNGLSGVYVLNVGEHKNLTGLRRHPDAKLSQCFAHFHLKIHTMNINEIIPHNNHISYSLQCIALS